MRLRDFLFVVAAIAVVIAGCSSSSSFQYRSQISPEADFTEFSTFGWVQRQGSAESSRGVDEALEEVIMAAVDTTLVEMGYSKATADPDMLMNFVITTVEKTNWGAHVEYASYESSNTGARRQMYRVGTLLVDAIDADSDSIVWSGSAEGVIEQQATVDFRIQRVNEAVRGLLKELPAKAE